MGERFGGETGLTNALGGTNPLPDAYYVKMQEIEKMPAAAAVIENLAGVELDALRAGYGAEYVGIFESTVGRLYRHHCGNDCGGAGFGE